MSRAGRTGSTHDRGYPTAGELASSHRPDVSVATQSRSGSQGAAKEGDKAKPAPQMNGLSNHPPSAPNVSDISRSNHIRHADPAALEPKAAEAKEKQGLGSSRPLQAAEA